MAERFRSQHGRRRQHDGNCHIYTWIGEAAASGARKHAAALAAYSLIFAPEQNPPRPLLKGRYR